ncbi:LysR family transcriptional regulator [Pseudonocardiaceae bacterium YIM PH 21723]|nr:LysR family transcriptional regulator [Pseudonocardiaceae bacterium YIM PH 21723]
MLHLRYFVAVAGELNFTRAAAGLHMATSPLSQRIKDLERELGTTLFVRSHHKLELTTAGETLLPAAREIIDRFDSVPQLVRESTGGPRTVTLGLAPEVSPELRSTVLQALATRHADVTVRLTPASSGPLVQALLSGELDLALIHGPVTSGRISTVLLESRPARVAVARAAGFDDRTSVGYAELAHLPYASIEHDAAPEIYRQLDNHLTKAGVRQRIIVEGHNLGGLAHVVASGQAFTIVGGAHGTLSKVFAGEAVTFLDLEPSPQITTSATWCHDRAQPGGPLADLVATMHDIAHG